MKKWTLILLVLSASFLAARASDETVTVKSQDLKSGRFAIIGELGLPLGTVAEIEGVVVAARGELPTSGVYSLRVDFVDGKPLSEAVLFVFEVAGWTDVVLPRDRRELARQQTGDSPVAERSESETVALERTYFETRHKLVVYEYAVIDGMPRKLPDDVVHWSDKWFGYSCCLRVLARRAS